MPKWRKLHVKALESEDIHDMPDDFTRLLWVLLPLVLDREGRGRYNDTWVRSKIFPLRNDVTDEQVCLAMGWLYTRRMIIPYQSNGRSYFHVPSFPRYQGDTSKEAESYYPPPPDLDDDDSRPTPELVESNSGVGQDLVATRSGSDADADSYADSDVEADAEPPAAAAAPLPPESRPEPNADPVVAHLFGLLDKAAVFVGSPAQGEQWKALLEITRDPELLTETFDEAAKASMRPSPRWCRVVLERCIRDNTRPGKWNGDGRARDEPAGKPYARDGPLRTILVEDSQGNITEETIG